MHILRTDNLIKTFKDGMRETRVLNGISLAISPGEFVAITGASGTGKSTLVHHLGLLDDPTGGSVHVEGKDAAALSAREKTAYRLRSFGFVFQDYALIPELRAWENVALPLLMRGESPRAARKTSLDALARLGMDHRAAFGPNQLSGGESQRVSIARAIAGKPSVLFADEPTVNLDTDRSRQIIAIFRDLHREGQTIIMVTHETDYANEASRRIVLEDGLVARDTARK